MPLVSILLPYDKNEAYVFKTINSVLKQTYKRFELIIIFDEYFKIRHNVYDQLLKLKKRNKKIKIILNKKNLGVAISRNIGLSKSRGKYIAFIDSDDLWDKKKLETQVNFMKKNNLKFSHTNYNIINEKDEIIGKFNSPKKLTYSKLINSCDIGTSTVMIDRSIIHLCKFPKLKTKEDFVVWLRFAKKKIPILSIDKFLTYWRSTSGSLSSSITQRFFDAFKVYNHYENFNITKSIFLTINLGLFSLIKKIKIYI